MKKKSLSLVIMAALLVALVAVYVIVSAKFAGADDSAASDTAPSYVTVNSIEQKNITAVSYTNKGVEYTFTLTDGVWKYAQDASFPVDTEAIGDMTSALSGIRAERAIDGDKTSKDYGLDSPAHTVKVTLSAGGTLTYNIGGYNKHSDTYYMTADGHDKIYMVTKAFGDLFAGELYDMLALESFPEISSDSITKITAITPQGSITLESSGEGEERTFTHTNVTGGSAALESETAEKIFSTLSAVKLSDCKNHNTPAESLAEYGLDEASRTKITVNYSTTVSTSTADGSASLGGSTSVAREFSYYIGRVTAPAENADTADTADTAETSANTSADSAKETVYLILEGSAMVYEVNISGAEVFFE